MSNFGTSDVVSIDIQNLREQKYHRVGKFDLGVTHPPMILKNQKAVTQSIQKWITPWPEISFEKIKFPKYEGVFQYIAEPSNIPDTIKDYHIISIARNIDYWSKPEYKAVITVNVGTVGSK